MLKVAPVVLDVASIDTPVRMLEIPRNPAVALIDAPSKKPQNDGPKKGIIQSITSFIFKKSDPAVSLSSPSPVSPSPMPALIPLEDEADPPGHGHNDEFLMPATSNPALAAWVQMMSDETEQLYRAAGGLHHALVQGANLGQTPFFRWLINQRASLDKAIAAALESGELCFFNFLSLSPYASHLKKCLSGLLFDAVAQRKYGHVHILLMVGADPCCFVRDGVTLRSSPLHHAAEGSTKEILELLINAKADMNLMNADDETPLYLAHPPNLRLLLDSKADPNIPCGRDKELRIHKSCGLRRPECVQALIAAGSKINFQNADGETPLFMAISDQYRSGPAVESSVRILLEAKANPLIQNKRKRLASQSHAIPKGIQKLLRQAEAWWHEHGGVNAPEDTVPVPVFSGPSP